jgi:hypothetical protein
VETKPSNKHSSSRSPPSIFPFPSLTLPFFFPFPPLIFFSSSLVSFHFFPVHFFLASSHFLIRNHSFFNVLCSFSFFINFSLDQIAYTLLRSSLLYFYTFSINLQINSTQIYFLYTCNKNTNCVATQTYSCSFCQIS